MQDAEDGDVEVGRPRGHPHADPVPTAYARCRQLDGQAPGLLGELRIGQDRAVSSSAGASGWREVTSASTSRASAARARGRRPAVGPPRALLVRVAACRNDRYHPNLTPLGERRVLLGGFRRVRGEPGTTRSGGQRGSPSLTPRRTFPLLGQSSTCASASLRALSRARRAGPVRRALAVAEDEGAVLVRAVGIDAFQDRAVLVPLAVLHRQVVTTPLEEPRTSSDFGVPTS